MRSFLIGTVAFLSLIFFVAKVQAEPHGPHGHGKPQPHGQSQHYKHGNHHDNDFRFYWGRPTVVVPGYYYYNYPNPYYYYGYPYYPNYGFSFGIQVR